MIDTAFSESLSRKLTTTLQAVFPSMDPQVVFLVDEADVDSGGMGPCTAAVSFLDVHGRKMVVVAEVQEYEDDPDLIEEMMGTILECVKAHYRSISNGQEEV